MVKVNFKKTISLASALAMLLSVSVSASELNGTTTIKCAVGDNISLGDFSASAAETQKLIDSRPDIERQVEDMVRGLVAVKSNNGVFVSWRWKGRGNLISARPAPAISTTCLDRPTAQA